MGIVGELYETRRNCRAADLIEEQQKKVKEYSTVWLVGEQLKAMCLQDRRIAALVEKDLESPGMGIAEAEQKIKAWADQQRSGNSCGSFTGWGMRRRLPPRLPSRRCCP